MKNYFILPLLLFTVFSFHVFAQNRFQEAIGDTGFDYGSSIMRLTNGGYIMSGTTLSFATPEVYLIKTDSVGGNVFAKHFGGTGSDGSNCVRQTTDGGFISAGTSNSFGAGGNDVYVIKTDSNFILSWSVCIGGVNDEFGRCIRQTVDGGYIVTGNISSGGAGGNDVYLLKLDATGNLLWTKIYGGSAAEIGLAVEQTNDMGFIITGYTTSFGAGGQDAFLIKTDSIGDALWMHTYGGLADDEAQSVQQTTDNGFILTGLTQSFGAGGKDVYVIKTDSIGNLTWSKTFGSANDDNGVSVMQTADLGYIIAAQSNFPGATNVDVYLVKTDSSGNLDWFKCYGGTSLDVGTGMDKTTDGGYVIGGITFSFSPVHADFYLIRTDSVGHSGCYESTPPTTSITPATIVSSVVPTTNSFGTMLTPATAWWYGGHVIMTCSTTGISDVEASDLVTVYPNPNNGNFTININSTNNFEKGQISIFNVMGEKVYDETFLNINDPIIQIKNVNQGIYFLKLINGHTTCTKKILIE